MNTKLEFTTYLKSTLTADSTKLLAADPTNTDTADRLDQIVRTPDDNVSEGHSARLAPSSDPFAPKLQLEVMHLNADIIGGLKVAPDSMLIFRCSQPTHRIDFRLPVAN